MRSKLPNIQPRFYPDKAMCLVCYDERGACVVGIVEYENLKGMYAKRVRKALTIDFYNEVAGSELTIVRYK